MEYEKLASMVARNIGKCVEVVVKAVLIGIVALSRQFSKAFQMIVKSQTIRKGVSKLRRVISR